MIISASRRTDIPAFYSEWFMNRVREGFVFVRNPIIPKSIRKVSLTPDKVDAFVFWTKNPEKLIHYLPELDSSGYQYYFLFTLTPYDNLLEDGLPPKEEILKIFKMLSDKIGKEKVIWRYDPILVCNSIDANYHVKKFKKYSSELSGYTSRCITSFMVNYKKCQKNMREFQVQTLSESQRFTLLMQLNEIATSNDIILSICADEQKYADSGVLPSCCVDNELINQITGKAFSYKKDKGQRLQCNCSESIDIGAYNTCAHSCKYCYANFDSEKVQKTIDMHDDLSPLLVGNLKGNETIKDK